ncbi:MAG: hypothetical protein R2789_14695 [Microthrixaceae bacterium]
MQLRSSDVVITMGCGDKCPFYPGKRYLDWELEDPAGRDVAAVRPIRDEIRRRVEELIGSRGGAGVADAGRSCHARRALRSISRRSGTAGTQPTYPASRGTRPGVDEDRQMVRDRRLYDPGLDQIAGTRASPVAGLATMESSPGRASGSVAPSTPSASDSTASAS